MPVTDLSGDDDWLQQFLAGHQAGQAFGASQAYGPQGVPGPYSGGPQGLTPGGGVMARQGATLGAPSMGYPALGQPTPQQPPAASPGPAQGNLLSRATTAGLNLNSNPLGWLGGLFAHGANAPPAGYPNTGGFAGGTPDSTTYAPGDLPQNWPPRSPAAPTTAPPAGRGIGSDANFPVMGAGGFPTTYSAPGQQPPVPTGPVGGANPANRGVGTNRTPGAGAPQGNPSQTPTPASNDRFVPIDRPNMSAAGGFGRGGPPQMTALNLAGLFGGRGQQVANPANVPAQNAMPVSGPLASGGMSNAPWTMGPQQRGVGWPSKKPYGPDWTDWASSRSGFA